MSDPLQLDKYEISGVLGKGAMGVVYAARDRRLGRQVAIKTVLTGHLEDEATRREYSVRFEREARAIAKLNHPNIVNVYDFGEAGDLAYLVMEYLQGRELKALFDDGQPLPVAVWAPVMAGLLAALAHAHSHGVVHRDIKPSNVMLLDGGGVKLMDFGVARLEDAGDETQVGTRIGTLAYMAPEQVQGVAVDHRIDLFAAGVILYQCLTGRKPFAGNEWELQRKIMFEPATPPSQLHSGVSAELDAVVARAMAKAPEHRFASATDFQAALEQAVRVAPVAAADEDDATRVLAPGLARQDLFDVAPGDETGLRRPGAPGPLPPPPKPAASGSRSGVLAGAGALGVVVLAGLGWWVWAPGSAPAPGATTASTAPTLPATTAAASAPPAAPAPPAEAPPPAPPPFQLTLATARGDNRFREGEAIALQVKPQAPAHVYCFMQDEKGEVLRFFPNRFRSDAAVDSAGIALPGSMKFRIQASFKGQPEAVMCLAYAQALPATAGPLAGGDFVALPVASLGAVQAALDGVAGPALAAQRLDILPRP